MYASYRGKRVLLDWLPEDKITEDKRAKVAWGQLKKWYKAGDILFFHKKEIEKEIYMRLRKPLASGLEIKHFFNILLWHWELKINNRKVY